MYQPTLRTLYQYWTPSTTRELGEESPWGMQKELMSDDPKGPLKEHELDSVSPESLALLFSQWAVWATVWSAHLYQLERRWGVPTEPQLVQQ